MGFERTAARKIEQLQKSVDRLMPRESSGLNVGELIASYMGLRKLRGFWPYSSLLEDMTAIDMSGQGRHLYPSGPTPLESYVNNMVPYVAYDAGKYYTRNTEPGLELTGAFTMLTWIYCAIPTAYPIYKLGSYALIHDGDLQITVVSGGSGHNTRINADVDVWTFACARFTPSTEVRIYNGSDYISNTTAVPASIDVSVNGFGSTGSGGYNYGQALTALCACALPEQVILNLYNMGRVFFGV